MKRVNCIILCITLLAGLFSSLCAYAAEDFPKVDAERYEAVTDVLKGVGVLDEDFELSGEGYVTYKELVSYLSRLIGNKASENSPFFGIEPGSLNEVASYDQTIEIMVNLLGWEYKASQKGYFYVANQLGLTSGVLNTELFARFDVLTIIYNSLTADYLEQTVYGTENKYSADATILSVYKDIYEFSGVLKANKWSTVYSAEGLASDKITVDEDELGITEFDYSGTKSMDLLGARISGFYRKNGVKAEAVAIWSDGDELVLDSNNEPYYDSQSRAIKYIDENGNDKNVNLPEDVTIVVNGRNYGNPGIINDKSFANLGTVTLYKTGGKYKSVHIKMYTNGVVQHITKAGSVIGFADNSSVNFDTNEYGETIFFYDKNGKEAKFSDIKVGNVVSLYKSIGNESQAPIINVYIYDSHFTGKVVSSQVLNGETVLGISEISYSDDSSSAVYGAEKQYKIAVGCNSEYEIGSCYKIYTDMHGKAAYFEYTSEGDGKLVGLYIKIVKKDGLSSGYQILMMPDLDSELQPGGQILEISEKAKINYEKNGIRKDVVLKNADISEINSALMHTAMYYYANSDGAITKITGCSSKSEDGYLYNFNPKGELLYTHTIASKDGKYLIECSKHYWTASSFYGGSSSNNEGFDKNNPDTFYGRYYLKYGDVSSRMIVLPDISSPDEISQSYLENYYKKAPVAQYGIVTKNAYHKYNAFSHNGGITPDYGTIAFDTGKITSTVSRYRLFGNHLKFLVNKVSHVSNPDGKDVIKLEGLYGVSKAPITLYSESDKIIDAAKSETGNIVYLDEISEGDLILYQCNANGEITIALKICDYDPENDIVTLPKSPDLSRVFKNEATGQLINECESENGIVNIKTLSDRRVQVLGYLYKTAQNVYTNGAMGFSLVADKDVLLNSQNPKINPEQYVFSFGSAGTVMYYNTKLNTPDKRIGTAGILNGVSYTQDPDDMSRVFVWSNLGETTFILIYK